MTIIQSSMPASPAAILPVLRTTRRWTGPVGYTLATWRKRHRYRTDLSRLLRVGPYMIADIGLPLEVALAEMAKPFWRR